MQRSLQHIHESQGWKLADASINTDEHAYPYNGIVFDHKKDLFWFMLQHGWTWKTFCCSCPVAQSCPIFVTLCPAARQAFLSFTISPSLLELVHWVHTAIQSSDPVTLFSSFPQSFPASRSFPVSQLFTSGGQNIAAAASVLPMNTQDWFPLGLIDLISLQSKGFSRVFSNTTVRKHKFMGTQTSLWSNSDPSMTPGKAIALSRQIFVGKVMSLLFNMLSTLVISFLPRSKGLLISWLQSPSAVVLEPQIIKSATISTVSLSICHEVMGPDAMIWVFYMLSFQPTFSLSSFTFIKGLFSSSLSAIRVVSSAYLRLLIFLPVVLIPACALSILAFLMMYSA